MYKFNPTEKQPCPKCGTDIDVTTNKKEYVGYQYVMNPYIKIECIGCGYWIRRRPLDYGKEEKDAKKE